ncbi:DUF2334 domain-containing protein [Kordiimonas marina]|uniref:DUF2334 domain-containing protein n=1 Tax=Kordiimonas marina TaxID=2872312 RepID=UPI001FF4DE81|nr:polysaccharide deacetylase family protein [Kordiimonas marina]MCJ9428835.1 polysaccharide deacetylase family protein [Kordiimonas marina]
MKQLLFSIHDVSPRHFDRLREIDAFLQKTDLGNNYAMLVVPNFWGEWPLEKHPEFGQWLREKADAGVEMILHGFYHKDTSQHEGRMAQFKATKMTAGEGEFLGLSHEDALGRIRDGRKLLEDILSRPVSGFIAPAWLYGEGAHAALKDEGFTFAEDHMNVWAPNDGHMLVERSPVISYASRSWSRTASSLLWSRLATVVLSQMKIVRQALHPHDFDKDVLTREIDRALRSLLSTRTAIRYQDLLAKST